ncbi:uncharacterized protein PV09_02622 [Verruconis gallopava]|uniref:Uncharacterized protein n=1 Tax=Verruconis gallopava TaxID=253628 RepID=A0A0D2AJ86_9PEZI|nr:uncharacterized protein PV09_02622 [Verruconis gallopava]KIW06963.1 hypothetical protein PV09_02622 [Verruconis gallopava]
MTSEVIRNYATAALEQLPTMDKLRALIKDAPAWKLGLGAGISYLALVRLLRYRRRDRIAKKYPYKTRADFSKMTADDAQAILRSVFECEFPFIGEKSLQFALFRTYGIPTISKLLVKTKQLSTKELAPRRLTDTAVLIAEFLGSPPSSERANTAIARMNYLHSLYQASGQISNEDMLYTLSLFAVEPVRWVNTFEWRELTPLEVCATGTFWKSVGDAMGISYEELPSYKRGWKDGIEWFEEVKVWALMYEQKVMLPTKDNHQTAVETTKMLLYDVPKPLHGIGENVVAALMDDRLREAMMYKMPPSWLQSCIHNALHIRKYIIRYLFLPRPQAMKMRVTSEKPNKYGKYNVMYYEVEPWYYPDNFTNRWLSLQTWVKWMRGLPIPGPQYKPEGYDVPNVGPKHLEGKGTAEMAQTKERLMASGRGGCPFA